MTITEERLPLAELGTVKIADEVVAVIAGLAATEVNGVAAMSGGIAGGIAEALGRRNLAKGVKVEVGAAETTIDIYIVANYGIRIPDVAWAIQENVKNAVEQMTGLRVLQVNVHVQGINFPQKESGGAREKESEEF